MRAPARFFIRLCPYLPLSMFLSVPIDIDLVFYGAFGDRELIRSPTDTCIKLTSGVRLPTHQPNGECHAIPSPLRRPRGVLPFLLLLPLPLETLFSASLWYVAT